MVGQAPSNRPLRRQPAFSDVMLALPVATLLLDLAKGALPTALAFLAFRGARVSSRGHGP